MNADPSGVSRETLERLEALAALVKKWSPVINLVSKGSLDVLWARHILDSVQVFDVVDPVSGHWVDLGSGAGFPGAVVAILAKERAPLLKVTCVESDQRKASFLRTVSRETSSDIIVVDERIEGLAPMECDVLSARALAPLVKLLGHAERHLSNDGVAVFPKGRKHADEVREARKHWRFDLYETTSRTDPTAVIFKIGALSRA